MIYKKENIDMSLVQCPYEEEQGYIHISDDYTNNVLKLSGYGDINGSEYSEVCNYNVLRDYVISYVSKGPIYSYLYARYVIKGRFAFGEPLIASMHIVATCMQNIQLMEILN
jgi:hypothetical protein